MKDLKQKFIDMHPTVNIQMLERFIKRKGVDSLLCPKCQDHRTIFANGSVGRTCGKKECHHMYGKKRPEHSRQMKQLSEQGLNAGNFKPGYKNKFINTLEWKMRVLENAGIDIPKNLNADEFNNFFNKHKSNVKKSKSTKITFIKTMYERYKDHYDLDEIEIDDIDNFNTKEIRRAERLLNSLKTLDSNKNAKGIAKRFIRTSFNDVRYCMNKTALTTRSSYETNYINFFEGNGISYYYEPYYIKCGTGFYLPDFMFDFDNHTYVLEVKGYLINKDQYISEKIKYAVDYCKNNNMTMLLSFDPSPGTMKELITKVIN